MSPLTADELVFLSQVESGEFPLARFNHAAHMRLAWLCLRQTSLPEAMIHFRDTLKAYAGKHGKSEIYNETITFAYLLLIHEALQRDPAAAASWSNFTEKNADLMARGREILLGLYPEQMLYSAEAKKVFRLPASWTP